MRIVVDLQACQTETSKDRGVGRYSEAFARQLAGLRTPDVDLRFCVNGGLDRVGPLVEALGLESSRLRVSAYEYPALERATPARSAASTGVAEALVRHHWMRLQPDVLHLSHVFEGYRDEAVVPRVLPGVPGLLRSATLYDLIPLRFQERYFADESFRRWYFRRIATLRACDLLLAISESSRRDAIELLGIAPDRIATIHAGADPRFTPGAVPPDEAQAFRRRFGLRPRIVLYTGGDEYRKNLRGAISGYAEVPVTARRDAQFVIVCAISAESRAGLRDHARRLGLARDEVIFPGYVSADDLLLFYRLCDAFIFPSFYEGLGLPVLEAMKCGAPVLGADSSGIGEIVGRRDALFDPRQPAALAERLSRALTDDAFRDDLRRHGIERATTFTWERSAAAALNAWTDARREMICAKAVPVAASLARRKIALFTPLPPSRSGIADYNAAFLPYLTRYFDVDVYVDAEEVADDYLQADVRLFPHGEFAARASGYHAVMYDMGNSEFHAYMLDYVERYPGVVVLHDAYLGGLYGYAEFTLGQAGRFFGEMLRAHGSRARRYLAAGAERPEPIRDAMIHLPATRSTIDAAIGVISHSPFNREVARRNYPEGFAAPYRIVPQMVRIPPLADEATRDAARASLGFRRDDFVVCTFGHVVWTKCGDMLLEAFARSRLAGLSNARLVYVGELAGDTFGDTLGRAIAEHPLASRIAVTGYLDAAAYEAYLRAADLAVQLRIHSRGGTPKGVLDCLAHALPVVVNNDASYRDYPDDVVMKLPSEPSIEALAGLFDRIVENPDDLAEFSRRGRDHVLREHAPEQIAALYALAIDEFARRAQAASLRTALSSIAEAVARDEGSLEERAASAGADLHAALSHRPYAPQRILVDVSHLTAGDHRTGIQRVVRNIVRALYRSDRPGFVPIAVRLHGKRLITAHEWLEREGLLANAERGTPDVEVSPTWGDCLLMLDSSWARYSEFSPVFDEVRRLHGTVYSVVYDLLPIRFPQYWPQGASAWFEDWLRRAVAASDGLVCISRAVADELDRYIATHASIDGSAKRLGFWHLGCDGVAPASDAWAPSERILVATADPRTLLMVGTLEPRKNHGLALSAMELLWERGSDARLCIAGKQGWLVEDLVTRIRRHPELGRRLHYVEQPSDEELAQCYRRCAAVLVPSSGEGFGLPLIEAARFATPIIASDLPVFREVAGEHATYFALGDPEKLATAVSDWLEAVASGSHVPSRAMTTLTWEESAEQLLDVILENRWYKRIVGSPAAAHSPTETTSA